jgi:hypothetical protein
MDLSRLHLKDVYFLCDSVGRNYHNEKKRSIDSNPNDLFSYFFKHSFGLQGITYNLSTILEM